MLKHLLSVICISFLSLSVQAQWTVDSLSLARSGIATATVNGKIIFAGGYSNVSGPLRDTIATRVDIYDIATESWSVEKLTIKREFTFAVGVGTKFYIAGYTISAAPDQDKIEVYDTEDASWSILALPNLVSPTTMCAYGNKIFFNRGNMVDVYNAELETWQSLTLPSNTFSSYATSCNGKVFFLGGESNNGSLSNTVDIYEVSSDTWTLENMTEGKNRLLAGCVNNKVFIVGGTLGSNKFTKLIEVFDTESGTWLEPISMNGTKTRFGLAATGNALYIASGRDESIPDTNSDVEVIDGFTLEKTIINMSSDRWYLGAIGVDDKVYFAGGFQPSLGEHVKTVDIYTEEETVSVHETTTNYFKIYPNPSHDEIYLFDHQHSLNEKPIVYQIFNQLGGLVLSGIYDGKIDTRSLNTGIYFLRYSGEISGCEKFIKH